MADKLDDILELKRQSTAPSIDLAANHQTCAGTIIQKRSGAVVFIGVVFLVIALVLCIKVGGVIYDESSGVNRKVLEMAENGDNSLRNNSFLLEQGFRPNRLSSLYKSIESDQKKAPIEGLVAIASLIAGVILLRLKAHLCSECGSKTGITTAKLCGNCGARFQQEHDQGTGLDFLK